MDGLDMQTPVDFSKLSDRDKQELNQFIINESQLGARRKAIHSLTDTCWKKCITSRISSAKLERAEDSCVQNCVDRFMDGTNLVLKQLEEMRQAGQV